MENRAAVTQEADRSMRVVQPSAGPVTASTELRHDHRCDGDHVTVTRMTVTRMTVTRMTVTRMTVTA
jgi:hypothetical protein